MYVWPTVVYPHSANELISLNIQGSVNPRRVRGLQVAGYTCPCSNLLYAPLVSKIIMQIGHLTPKLGSTESERVSDLYRVAFGMRLPGFGVRYVITENPGPPLPFGR